MGILPYKVLCNAALCVFHISLLKVALSNVLDPNIEMNRKSRPVPDLVDLVARHIILNFKKSPLFK